MRPMARWVMSMPIPAAVEFLGDLDGGAAAAEGVEDYVAFVG